MNELVGDKRTVAVEGGAFQRIVVVVNKDDGVDFDAVPDNPDKIIISVKRDANNPNANRGQS